MSINKEELTHLIVELKKFFVLKGELTEIKEFIDEPPVYTKPELSINLSPKTIECCKTCEINIHPLFVKNDGGDIEKIVIQRNGEIIHEGDSITNVIDTININHNVTVTYNVDVTYKQGPIKNTIMGVPYEDGRIMEGSINANGTVTGYALSYYGVIENDIIIDNMTSILKINRNNTFNNLALNNERFVYMFPKSMGEITSIKDANGFEYIDSYTKSIMEYNNVEYLVYMLTDPVKISEFKQTFI